MEIKLYNIESSKTSNIDALPAVFEIKKSSDLIHQVAVSLASNARKSIAHTKDRGEVRGGGKKPWKQKGTGRARHGSIRSPIWKGGGVAFGPRSERNFTKKINSKMRKNAVNMVLSAKLKDGELLVVDNIDFNNLKTKNGYKTLTGIFKDVYSMDISKIKPSVLLVSSPEELEKSNRIFSNIEKISCVSAKNINVQDLLSSRYAMFTKNAFDYINKSSSK